MSKKEIFRWSHAQEILLKELVGKKIILVDKATSNNSKMRGSMGGCEVTDKPQLRTQFDSSTSPKEME